MPEAEPTRPRRDRRRWRALRDRNPVLRIAAAAWLKLQYFCHAAECEIGGFGVSAPDDPLYVEDFRTVRQAGSWASVGFEDDAVADHFDAMVDAGVPPERFARIWAHTHPGDSADPSGVDEETFERVFGDCSWAVMFILARGGRTYARLSFAAGPGGSVMLPVAVDWTSWPATAEGADRAWSDRVADWREEFAANIRPPTAEEVFLEGPNWPSDPREDELHAAAVATWEAEEAKAPAARKEAGR